MYQNKDIVSTTNTQPNGLKGDTTSDYSFTNQHPSRPPLPFSERMFKCKRKNLILSLLPARKVSLDLGRVKNMADLLELGHIYPKEIDHV